MEPTQNIKVTAYVAESGSCPFEEWLDNLDRKARMRLLARIAKIRAGNLGDWSSLRNANGVCEFREHFGPGYRIYFGRENQQVILLLCGSIKSDQNRTIRRAAEFWSDYQKRGSDKSE